MVIFEKNMNTVLFLHENLLASQKNCPSLDILKKTPGVHCDTIATDKVLFFI